MIYSGSYREKTAAMPLLFLMFGPKRESTLFVKFEPYGSGTLVKISGSAPPKSKRWLDGLAAEMNERARKASDAPEDQRNGP